jgi:hypothetical protein
VEDFQILMLSIFSWLSRPSNSGSSAPKIDEPQQDYEYADGKHWPLRRRHEAEGIWRG